AVGGDFARRDPVDEAPPGELAEQTVWLLMPAEPVENGARPRNHGADEPLAVGAVEPVIVDHADPKQGKSWNRLHQRARIAAKCDSVRRSGLVEGLNGLAGKPVVAGHGIRNKGLNASVAYVLKLLVVGRVHVGFVGVEARGAP